MSIISRDVETFAPCSGAGHRAERPLLVSAHQAGDSQRGVALPAQRGLAPDAAPRPVSQLPGVLQRCYSGKNETNKNKTMR